MRILWFSVTPSLYNPNSNFHNGGGWIASLEQIVRKEKTIELGVAFCFEADGWRHEVDGVTYYTIGSKKNNLDSYLKIIEDFKPDLIQIFGSENEFGIICANTNIPVVIHMQGCLPPYHNALFPVGMNSYDFLFQKGLSWRYRFMGLRSEGSFRRRAEREIATIQSCRYFMGRTDWDKRLVGLFNPRTKYFHCEEALRDSFLKTEYNWEFKNRKKVKIISVISNPWYKGMDLILKTAKNLKTFTELDFEWNVFGVRDVRFYECKYKINAASVNVNIKGVATKDELVKELLDADCYVHSSYIDNSPNSLCEAQLIGVPVLATFVGGIPYLVKNGETGLLFPANDPYTLASLIGDVVSDRTLAISLSQKGRVQALNRHNPEKIGETLLNIYKQIIDDKNS